MRKVMRSVRAKARIEDLSRRWINTRAIQRFDNWWNQQTPETVEQVFADAKRDREVDEFISAMDDEEYERRFAKRARIDDINDPDL